MDAYVIDIAVAEGRYAARRLALRSNHKPSDQEEVLAQAGDKLAHELSRLGYSATVIEEGRFVMVDAFMAACEARNTDLHS